MTKYCNECEHAESYPDPDPHDWFCDDDILWKCKQNDAMIQRCCRPYQKIEQPKWCPARENQMETEETVNLSFKFELGQRVFCILNNKVVGRPINHRVYRDNNVGDEIEQHKSYMLEWMGIEIPENELFATKEELLASL